MQHSTKIMGLQQGNNKKAIIIGDVNVDIITPPFSPEQLLEGETSIVLDDFTTSLGGNAINVAAFLASLGDDHLFLGGLGDCGNSIWIQQKCDELGINTKFSVMPNKSAGITFALTYTEGRRQFVATLGTNKHITMDKLDLSTLEDQDLSNIHLHRSGFWYTPRLKGQPTIELFKKVISQGGETSLDVGWDPEGFSEQNRNVLFQTLKYTKFFFANEKEIKAMTQENDIKQAYDILLNNSDIIEDPVIVVHRGERGCGIIRKEKREFIKPIVLEELINPTGSGDIFNGGFIHGLLNDLSNKKSAEFANLAACVHISDIEKIYPTLEEIEIFKKAQNK